jgi:hypothetical protein
MYLPSVLKKTLPFGAPKLFDAAVSVIKVY